MGRKKQNPNNKANRTDKQRAASRANGALSHGPVTSEGKAASSRNSLRHGLRAKNLTLANEHPEILAGLISDFNQEFQPESHTEHALVLEMAYSKWRQYRTWMSEAAEINKCMLDNRQALEDTYAHIEEPIRTASAVQASLRETRALDLYNRTEAKCTRQYHRALAALLAIRKNKKRTNEPENLPAEVPANGPQVPQQEQLPSC